MKAILKPQSLSLILVLLLSVAATTIAAEATSPTGGITLSPVESAPDKETVYTLLVANDKKVPIREVSIYCPVDETKAWSPPDVKIKYAGVPSGWTYKFGFGKSCETCPMTVTDIWPPKVCPACGMKITPEMDEKLKIYTEGWGKGERLHACCIGCALRLLDPERGWPELYIQTTCDATGKPIRIHVWNHGKNCEVDPPTAKILLGAKITKSCKHNRIAYDDEAAKKLLEVGYTDYTMKYQHVALPEGTPVLPVAKAAMMLPVKMGIKKVPFPDNLYAYYYVTTPDGKRHRVCCPMCMLKLAQIYPSFTCKTFCHATGKPITIVVEDRKIKSVDPPTVWFVVTGKCMTNSLAYDDEAKDVLLKKYPGAKALKPEMALKKALTLPIPRIPREIVWTGTIPPSSFQEFKFIAKNPPTEGVYTWTATVKYADGTIETSELKTMVKKVAPPPVIEVEKIAEKAEKALAKAEEAKTSVDKVTAIAGDAKKTADEALTEAKSTSASVKSLEKTVKDVEKTLGNVKVRAESAVTTAGGAKSTADSALSKAKAASMAISGLTTLSYAALGLGIVAVVLAIIIPLLVVRRRRP